MGTGKPFKGGKQKSQRDQQHRRRAEQTRRPAKRQTARSHGDGKRHGRRA